MTDIKRSFHRSVLVVVGLLLWLTGGAAAADYFTVGLEQDGRAVPIVNHQATLQKRSFTIVVSLAQPDGILVNASFAADSYDSAQAGRPLSDIVGFTDLGMAEEAFNPQAALMASRRAPHYWYYQHDANHRFNDVRRREGRLVCRRIVANIMDRDATRHFTPLDQLAENTLYLVFMNTEWTQDFSRQLEKQRDYLKLVFR
jgi:hypothetical protein